MTLTKGETAYIDYLAPYLGETPRSALRFLNVYRVIKASLDPAQLLSLEQGGYLNLMTQLAITTGAPGLERRWGHYLATTSDDEDLNVMVQTLTGQDWVKDSPEGPSLAGALQQYLADRPWAEFVGKPASGPPGWTGQFDKGIRQLRNYRGIAARYSFDI